MNFLSQRLWGRDFNTNLPVKIRRQYAWQGARAFWKEKEEKLLAFPEELEPFHVGDVFKAFFD